MTFTKEETSKKYYNYSKIEQQECIFWNLEEMFFLAKIVFRKTVSFKLQQSFLIVN